MKAHEEGSVLLLRSITHSEAAAAAAAVVVVAAAAVAESLE